jgi:hypothetical protein
MMTMATHVVAKKPDLDLAMLLRDDLVPGFITTRMSTGGHNHCRSAYLHVGFNL